MSSRFASLCAAGGALLAAPAFAQEGPAFTVGDIRVEGLQRVTEGTVYNYLPINIGDKQYDLARNYATPGAKVFAGVRYGYK